MPPAAPNPKHKMYKVMQMSQNGRKSASVIRVDSTVPPIHVLVYYCHFLRIITTVWQAPMTHGNRSGCQATD